MHQNFFLLFNFDPSKDQMQIELIFFYYIVYTQYVNATKKIKFLSYNKFYDICEYIRDFLKKRKKKTLNDGFVTIQ